MSNSISFVGRLVADSELKTVGQHTVLEFRIANNVGFGEKKSVNWFRCALWGSRGEKLVNHFAKGKEFFITGELSLRPWTNSSGVEQVSAEINVKDFDFVGGRDDAQQSGNTPASSLPVTNTAPTSQVEEEELPF